MSKDKPFLDRVAEQLSGRAESISQGRLGSDSICQVDYCSEKDVVGDFPQASPLEANGDFLSDGYLYFERFPEPAGDPIQLFLEPTAKWTDVLSASTTYDLFLVNAKALEVFKQFNLGNVRYYNATVTDKKTETRNFTYVFFCNHLTLDDIDFSRSECHLVDMISQPIRELEVIDKEDFWAKQKLAQDGALPDSEQFSKIAIGKIQLQAGHAPKVDLFGLSQIGTTKYASTALRDALVDARVTGLEFKQNTRLFF